MIPAIVLSQGDDEGRILRFVLYDGGAQVASTGLSCRFLLDDGAGLYQQLTAVSSADTATWEAALSMGGVNPGQHKAAFEVTDSSDNIVCTRVFTAIVEPGILEDAQSSTEMQDALTDFEQRVQAAENIADGLSGISIAVDASTGLLTVVSADGTTTTYDVQDAVDDAVLANYFTIPDSVITAMVDEEWM